MIRRERRSLFSYILPVLLILLCQSAPLTVIVSVGHDWNDSFRVFACADFCSCPLDDGGGRGRGRGRCCTCGQGVPAECRRHEAE